jgi:WhiB family redox-sensing transcriptional regulator
MASSEIDRSVITKLRRWANVYEHAYCKGTTLDFFPPKGQNGTTQKALCHTCPVENECGEMALEDHLMTGIYGGMTGKERRRILRKRHQYVAPIGDDND